ncbi:MAG: oxygen-independent coproporphyrinogen III oxidase, partial [Proteobacteria bacterium]|nr:oxygen-independent coproporphyrinogen III oxidase [Pseudomonadota bacterium]
FDREMINRYNHSGPRYTSYPTAVTFHENFSAEDYNTACQNGNDDPVPAPLSLYFHVPFCDTVCFYCGCNKIVTRHKSRAQPYLEVLGREIEIVGAKFAADREVEQLHFGGGTPTFLSEEEISQLMWKVQSHFNARPADSKDYSIEIDPRSVTPHYIKVLGTLGFNRYSLGVQDVDIKVQKAVNRVQSAKMTREVLSACRDAGAKSINIDLIYGLPFQTPVSFRETVDVVIDMSPDRLSIFNYAHLPEMFKAQRRINAEDLPNPEEKLQILQNTIEQLSDAGYVYIGMDHFAKPDDELVIARETGHLHRNFQGYTTHGNCDLVAMGVSSISKIRGVFSQNYKDEASYTAALNNGDLPILKGYVMNDEDRLRAEVIQRIACYGELDMAAIERRFKIDFKAHFSTALNALEPMVQDGLVRIGAASIEVTAKGRLLVRNICMAFDEYTQSAGNTRFSKAI